MTPSVRLFSRAWAAIAIGAVGLLAWTNHARIQRVRHLSSLPGRAEAVDVLDPASPTGYAGAQRELIVPGGHENSYEWIAQTQQMFARREWRVRHVDYDNAPLGREVTAASPYRWWLGLIAWLDHAISGRPLGLSVERAALWADPALHGLLLLGGTALVAWQFGGGAAALFALGLVAFFPLAAGFLPGVPDDRGLANICALGSVLMLLAGRSVRRGKVGGATAGPAGRRDRRWFALAGAVGGLGMWMSVPTQGPILTGILLGALLEAWIVRRGRTEAPPEGSLPAPPWRLWSRTGGGTILVCYLIEFFPDHLGSWQLNSIHPLYGLAWIGAGELLARTVTSFRRGEGTLLPARDLLAVVLGAGAIAAVPIAMYLTGSRGLLAVEMSSFQLTHQPNGAAAPSLWAWWVRDGISATVVVTVLPVILLLPAGWMLWRRDAGVAARASLALALGPAAVALALACWQLGWWRLFDGVVLALAVAAMPAHGALQPRSGRWLWTGLATVLAIPGMLLLWPPRIAKGDDKLTSLEVEELIDRDLAHWLANRAGEKGAVVFAPPRETANLAFYGGLRGIGTFNPDNAEGLRATITLASVTTLPEAQILVRARQIKYIALPTWDPFFDEYADLFLVRPQSGRKSILIPELRRLNLPPWLRPLPFQPLRIQGYERQSVLVLEVVEEQNPAAAMSRLAEYLVETGDLERAAAVGQALRRFPGDLGALAARAQVESARGDAASFNQSVDLLLTRLADGADRSLAWDRRVSLAIVLARGDRTEPARAQVHRCLAELDAAKARSLTIGSLFNLLVLSRAFQDPIADPKLQALTLDLLPLEMRDRL